MRWCLSIAAVTTAVSVGAAVTAPVSPPDDVARPMLRAALQTPRALRGMMLGIARAGARLVAVGERGAILLSDDHGVHWHQARVPTSSTLTAVRFADERVGWAVGHSGLVLRTRDGGDSWERQIDGAGINLLLAPTDPKRSPELDKRVQQLVQDGADKPLLDVLVRSPQEVIVIGAYGLALKSSNGGLTWRSLMAGFSNPKGLHLNAIASRGEEIIVVGEQGLVLKSADAGERFAAVSLPYSGSIFSVAMPPDGSVLLGGLRGNVFHAKDIAAPFAAVSLPMPLTVNAMAVLPGGSVALGNQAGNVFTVGGTSTTATAIPQGAHPPAVPLLSAMVATADGALVGVGAYGPVRLMAGTQK